MKKITINDIYFGGDSLGLILGPCVIESRDHSLMMARPFARLQIELGLKQFLKVLLIKQIDLLFLHLGVGF